MKLKLKLNPSNRKTALELANHYLIRNEIDSAEIVYMEYLKQNPEDNEVRYELARKLTWFKQFDKAKAQADILLTKHPNNIEYQLIYQWIIDLCRQKRVTSSGQTLLHLCVNDQTYRDINYRATEVKQILKFVLFNS